ncbi:bifunctional demethylmenaquinone methyltransferase/2-methoxy-6-polyprenyl-1,4-benzoquinol methylase UbiE [Campylobacter magnus]|uniref:Demethylmenaquinone methyltransferase n=1 Tax=Campylobacter magnus TaxID=3026462 RepID=A0ABT8T6U0_9BACT|nr:bifunctional demethylmenaquinone methyltransferase/2-methoxy-6-polyprenyl-1,4-benzoquinol methylase UbiE [Campylobacter magnus]MDO2409429.1 bifunctional demethylmenaquinone methyltransferase/2-methoxy-6-polyprenyl-1,4-benzoquinol methylase UbiE [Campylobacter magnus]
MNSQEKIVEMFDKIAPSYDLANRVLSFGIDKSWRKKAVDFVLKKFSNQTISIVDMACGTGDMIALWQGRAGFFGAGIKDIVGVDPSSGMLEVAQKKFSKSGVRFINSLAHESGIEDDFADIISISYGIRNVKERSATLLEFNRILKPGGYLLVLEFTKREKKGFISALRDFYLSKILPKIGGAISKQKEAYEYLPSSIENFLDTDSFKTELKEAGFQVEIAQSFSFGISTMFVAKKVVQL